MNEIGPWVPDSMVFAYDNQTPGGSMGRYTHLTLDEREEIMPQVLDRSATPCLGLEMFEVSNLRRCCTHGSTVFAPVVRGKDPDREAALRAAYEHQEDRGADRPGQVHGEPRAEAWPVVRVQ